MTQATAHADSLSPFRALHSLVPVQADQIVASLSSLATSWNIERHESCDGQLSLVLTHNSDDTTLVVGRDVGGIHVHLMHGDVMHATPERHTSIAAVAATLTDLAGKGDAASQQRSA